MRSGLLFAAIFVSGAASGQFLGFASAQDKVPTDLPTFERQSRPKMTLRSALKIAEDYVASKHVNVSKGWMSEARFILYGDQAKTKAEKEPSWLFVWRNGGSQGNQWVEIIVSMDGKAMQLPSM